MSKKCPINLEANHHNTSDETDTLTESTPASRLERRRRIEDLAEEKRMREESGEYDLV